MSFPHESPDFADLVSVVATKTGLGLALVEKDYWVTHALWSLHQTGLEICFKGGTSLSKGFDIINRFSEDLDLVVARGSVGALPSRVNWKSMNKGPIARRREFFDTLEQVITVAGATVELDRSLEDARARSANYHVQYPSRYLDSAEDWMRPYVMLEIGTARVTPSVERAISSFVHVHLHEAGLADEFDDNRALAVRCVHPLVTLLEKLDAITRHYERGAEPPAFIRHYEDAARIVLAQPDLPALDWSTERLVEEMTVTRDLRMRPSADHDAFTLADADRRDDLEQAHQAIALMFFGERISLTRSCQIIREWIAGSSGSGSL